MEQSAFSPAPELPPSLREVQEITAEDYESHLLAVVDFIANCPAKTDLSPLVSKLNQLVSPSHPGFFLGMIIEFPHIERAIELSGKLQDCIISRINHIKTSSPEGRRMAHTLAHSIIHCIERLHLELRDYSRSKPMYSILATTQSASAARFICDQLCLIRTKQEVEKIINDLEPLLSPFKEVNRAGVLGGMFAPYNQEIEQTQLARSEALRMVDPEQDPLTVLPVLNLYLYNQMFRVEALEGQPEMLHHNTQAHQLVAREQAARKLHAKTGGYFPTVGVEVESPTPYAAKFRTVLDMLEIEHYEEPDYKLHEASPKPTYAAALQARLVQELKQMQFIDHPQSARSQESGLYADPISLHLNFGLPTTLVEDMIQRGLITIHQTEQEMSGRQYRPSVVISESISPPLEQFSTLVSLAFTSLSRLLYKKTTRSYSLRVGERPRQLLPNHQPPTTPIVRLELASLEVGDPRLNYRAIEEVQFLVVGLFRQLQSLVDRKGSNQDVSGLQASQELRLSYNWALHAGMEHINQAQQRLLSMFQEIDPQSDQLFLFAKLASGGVHSLTEAQKTAIAVELEQLAPKLRQVIHMAVAQMKKSLDTQPD